MKKIGIIEDNVGQCNDIQVSILDNWQGDPIDFKIYQLDGITRQNLFNTLSNDIINNEIQTLVVDFKLDTKREVLQGKDIIEYLHDSTPEFPVVILTNAPEDGKMDLYTDADKVYAKKVFLNPELEETRELVNNLQLNMSRYITLREKLETELDAKFNELSLHGDDIRLLGEIADLENKLSGYKNIDMNLLDMNKDYDDIKELLKQIEEIETGQ